MKQPTEYKIMLMYFQADLTSDDFDEGSYMNLAMYAYETYGTAVRDNSFQELIALGLELERGES